MTNNVNQKTRLFYLDNIRLVMIILVVALHAAITYSGIGSWFYTEGREIDDISKIFFLVFQVTTQAYFMGLLFFVAGLFVPGSLDRKGVAKFIKDRSFRLGLPSLLFILVIGPIAWIILKPSLLFGSAFLSFLKDYYLTFDLIGRNGPLWFAIALLIFSIIYALLYKKLNLNFFIDQSFPSKKSAFKLIGLMTIITFVVRLFSPIGENFYNMQFCFFTQYIFLFGLGILAAKKNFLDRLSYKESLFWLKISIVSIFTILPLVMIFGGALEGNFDNFVGGLHWQAFALVAWEEFFAVSFSLGLLGLFREKLNFQNKFGKMLSQNAFSVYVWHTPILIGTTLLLGSFYWYPLLKFAIATFVALSATFLFSEFIARKIPFFNKIL